MKDQLTVKDLENIVENLPPAPPIESSCLMNSKLLLKQDNWIKLQNDYILYMSSINK
jgi:hypothetical protein